MEGRERIIRCGLLTLLLLGAVSRVPALSVTVNDEECVYEYVLYEGDTVSGNFVVVDHDIFWGSDHPGIDFTVMLYFPFDLFSSIIARLCLSFLCVLD
ncbi:hypothetical protein ACJIZ3_017559 [Penstemon smallii]|uniref:Uncharacterized protein n=1 Tax=Penstemon smallii TaxID=265156 RepID=A0ABD3SX62_9LAMI